jgi:hypothetical protein
MDIIFKQNFDKLAKIKELRAELSEDIDMIKNMLEVYYKRCVDKEIEIDEHKRCDALTCKFNDMFKRKKSYLDIKK